MALNTGETLGPYEIVAPLGAGGMGEVYRARDTRLDRSVAIKVLPEHIATREDARARFEREARAVASLNHPNICTLYDIGNQDSTNYMVMELIEGETVAARIEKGAIPLDRAIHFATQIADALDRAHRAGVTHRDIKPGNIMFTRDGVKVLDFGLAKSPEKPGPDGATLTKALTTEGAVVGTPQYMAPEQFEGKEADARSDIWAFGAVVYEMVTGQKAFQGKSYSSLVGAILAKDPPPMAVKPFTPAWLERLVRRCLAKVPEDRWQSMRDIVLELRSPVVESVAAPVKSSRWPHAVAAACALASMALGYLLWRAPQPSKRPLLRVETNLEASNSRGATAILSPDGTRLVYVATGAQGKACLWTRRMDQPKAVMLEGTAEAEEPFFSPDGQWVAFQADGKLKKVSVDGGTALTLCDAPAFRGGSWGEDGNIIAAIHLNSPLMRVPGSGGKPEPATRFDTTHQEIRQRWPQVLQGGNAVLFTSHTMGGNYDSANIDVWSFKDGKRKTVHQGSAWARYIPTGHLIYLFQSTLFAVPFDVDRLEKRGNPVPVLEEVASDAAGGRAMLDHSWSGDVVYRSGITANQETIQWLDAEGKRAPLLDKPGLYADPRLSPDGLKLALAKGGLGKYDIWVHDLRRDAMTRLTFDVGSEYSPVWSPKGNYIIYGIVGQGIFRVKADGSGKPEKLLVGPGRAITPTSISPDGRRLFYHDLAGSNVVEVMSIPLDADAEDPKPGKPELLLKSEFPKYRAMVSPNGRWVAYESTESGSIEVYVRPFPDTGGKWMISTGGGTFPVWSRNGRELYFLGQDSRLMVVDYSARAGAFSANKPRVWSEMRLARRGTASVFDIGPDGARFAVVVPGGDAQQPKLTFLFHFFDELKRRVPAP